MNVRFNSNKERHPDQENGLRVLYGPSKRTAYRLRWYLIMALVGSPLIWMVMHLLSGLVHRDMPAQVELRSEDVRSLESGRVEEIPVQVGGHVQRGQLLARLSNPEWQLRNRQLKPLSSLMLSEREKTVDKSQTQIARKLQARAIALQTRNVNLYQGLEQVGGLSSAEVLQAEAALTSQRMAQIELERRLRQDRLQGQGTAIETLRTKQEHHWIEDRLQRLVHIARTPGRVLDILVEKGENVGPGTLLMRLEKPEPPVLWIYLRPEHSGEAWPGRRVQVAMPDGSWRQATILSQADVARRLPSGLAQAASPNGLSLRVPARFLHSLPTQWHVDQLPLTVRFPGLLARLPQRIIGLQ
jgi:hypothetical protein